MRANYYKGIGIFCLIALFAIFWVVVKPKKPGHQPPTGLTTKTPSTAVQGEQEMAKSNVKEMRQIDVTFLDGEKKIPFKMVPLIEVEKDPVDNSVVQVSLKADVMDELIKRIPQPPQEEEFKPAQEKSNGEGKIVKIIRGNPAMKIDLQETRKVLENVIREEPLGDEFKVAIVKRSENEGSSFDGLRKKLGFSETLAESKAVHDKEHSNDVERNINLSLASGKIDGLILQPGETFSFDKVVGKRSKANGYKEAGVISQGRIIKGLGGGICQVSTALYNAVLLANLKVTERHNHSMYDGISYVQRGKDAAIAWGYKDFKFVNSLPFPIIVSCVSGQGWVGAAIYGKERLYDRVEILTRNEKVLPFKVERKVSREKNSSGKKVVRPGINGYTIDTFRLVTSGTRITEEKLHKDHYQTYSQLEEISN